MWPEEVPLPSGGLHPAMLSISWSRGTPGGPAVHAATALPRRCLGPWPRRPLRTTGLGPLHRFCRGHFSVMSKTHNSGKSPTRNSLTPTRVSRGGHFMVLLHNKTWWVQPVWLND